MIAPTAHGRAADSTSALPNDSIVRMSIKRPLAAIQLKAGVWAASVGLMIGGASAMYAGQDALGWVGLGLGFAMFVWGIRIHGFHVWNLRWRHGRPSPFRIAAGVDTFDYAPGSVVCGIPWEQGFAHVWVTITNVGGKTLENVDAGLAPEHPIVRSSVHCAFADCRIGPVHGPIDTTFLITYPDGTELAEPHDMGEPGNYSIEPAHRLRCDKLPAGAEVKIDLATVVPDRTPNAGWFWKKARTDPTGIRVRILWTEDGRSYGGEQLLELKGIHHAERRSSTS